MYHDQRRSNKTMYSVLRYTVILLTVIQKKVNTDHSECSNLDFTDALWPKQWYLNRSLENKYDHNVLPAWRACINGTGIVIGIVDGGIYNNTDLNIRSDLRFDPFPAERHDKAHGTNVAGIAAAEKNGIFGVGVAFGAQIADVRLIVRSPTLESEAAALTSSLEFIDIYSSSFIHFPDGFSIHHLSPVIQNATRKGITYGRQGKGSIYVWATGNGGATFLADSCAFEGFCNNIDVIAVAGIRFDLSKVSNGERCSAIMVSAFTVGDEDTDFKMYTTDGTNNFTEHFGRNSAAVPMVAGGIALALQANPELGYRDIMHLLILTARGDLPYPNSDFKANGAGLNVSSSFGFGLMDIGALVEESKHWHNVHELLMCGVENEQNQRLRYNQSMSISFEDCDIAKIEHVMIYINATNENIGHIPMSLASPSGTISMVVPGRSIDFRESMEMNVTSVHFWNEIPFGNWFFLFQSTYPPTGILHSWKLFIYGTKTTKEETFSTKVTTATSEEKLSLKVTTGASEEKSSLKVTAYDNTTCVKTSKTTSTPNSTITQRYFPNISTNPPGSLNKEILAAIITTVVLLIIVFLVVLLIIIWKRRKTNEVNINNSRESRKEADHHLTDILKVEIKISKDF